MLVTASCPPCMQRLGPWRVEDFDLTKQLYKGKASLLFRGTCRMSGTPVALKFYRKSRLSALNWFQVGVHYPHSTSDEPPILPTIQGMSLLVSPTAALFCCGSQKWARGSRWRSATLAGVGDMSKVDTAELRFPR